MKRRDGKNLDVHDAEANIIADHVGILFDGANAVEVYRLHSILGRLHLELRGTKFRPIPGYGSTHNYVKRTYGISGNRQKVLKTFEDMLRKEGIYRDD